MKCLKKISIIAILILTLVSLSACGGNKESEVIYVEEGATKITVYAREFEQWARDHLESLVNEFNKDLTDGIQVNVKFYTQDTYADALTVARENGKAPDLYMTTYGELYTNIQNKNATDISSYLSEAAKEDILDTALELVTYDDKVYAYPWNLEPGTLLFYRKDMLQAAGVTKAPTSWSELLDACAKIKPTLNRAQYCIGLPLGGTENAWVTYGMQQNTTGGLALDDSWKNHRLDNEGYKQIAKLFYDVYSNEYAPTAGLTSEGYTYIVDALCDGKLAMTFAGSWCVAEIYDYTNNDLSMVEKIGVAPIPTINGDQSGTTSANGGWCYCISEQSKNKDKAAQFLNWMFTESAERTAQYFIEAYNSKAPTSQSVKDYLDTTESNVPSEWTAVINEVAAKGIPEPIYPFDIALEVGKILERMQLQCQTEDFEPLYAKAVNEAKNNIETIMTRSTYPSNPKFKESEGE